MGYFVVAQGQCAGLIGFLGRLPTDQFLKVFVYAIGVTYRRVSDPAICS